MAHEAFYSSTVALLVAIVIALAAQGFVRSEKRKEREAELRETAWVLTTVSLAATTSMFCLYTGYHSAGTAAMAAGGVTTAWVFLLYCYFESALKQMGEKRIRTRSTRNLVIALLAVAVALPFAGAALAAVYTFASASS